MSRQQCRGREGWRGRATLSCAACTSAKRRQAKGGVWIQIMEGKKEGLEEEEPRSERYGLWGHPYMTPAQMLRYLTPLSLCLHPQIRIFHISPLVWTSYMYGPLLRVIVPQPSQSRAWKKEERPHCSNFLRRRSRTGETLIRNSVHGMGLKRGLVTVAYIWELPGGSRTDRISQQIFG